MSYDILGKTALSLIFYILCQIKEGIEIHILNVKYRVRLRLFNAGQLDETDLQKSKTV